MKHVQKSPTLQRRELHPDMLSDFPKAVQLTHGHSSDHDPNKCRALARCQTLCWAPCACPHFTLVASLFLLQRETEACYSLGILSEVL